MKKFLPFISLPFLLIVCAISACENVTISTSNGESGDTVSGNGVAETKSLELGSFDQIDIEGVFNVVLTQGKKESVSIETDESIQPMILSSVENGILKIKMKDSVTINKIKKITVRIGFVQLHKLSTTGVGSLETPAILNLDRLEFTNKGVGLSELKINADSLTIRSEQVGGMKLSGHVSVVKITQNGLGAIDAFGLISQRLQLDADGIGAAQVNVQKELVVNAKGLGAVQVKGDPKVKRIKQEGLGKVEEVE